MIGSGWCGHLLKVEVAYLCKSQSLIFSEFSSVAGNGRVDGRPGGGDRTGHPHDALDCWSTELTAAAAPT